MMKKRIIYSLFLWSAFVFVAPAHAQTIEKKRTVNETFVLPPGADVEITNKYGDINIVPWQKDSIRFEVEIIVIGTKQSRVDKSFDYIDIDFKTSKYYIIAQTLFAGKNSFWSDVSDLTGTIFNSNTKTRIDYTVHIPESANLKIRNKFGNIYTTDHTGSLEIELSNGNLKAHRLSGQTKITAEFGDSDIKFIKSGQLNLSYGEFMLTGGDKIAVESKSVELNAEIIKELTLSSRRDKFYIDTIGHLSGNTYFTLINTNQLTSGLQLTTKYGDVDIKGFSDTLKSFGMNTNNTDVTLHFTGNKYYKINIIVDKETEVYYASSIQHIISKELEGKEKLTQVDCRIGKENNKPFLFDIDSRGGSLSLKLK